MPDKKADVRQFRDKPGAIAAYLSKAFEKNDLDVILKAINRVMRAQNVMVMARKAGLPRSRLYKSYGGEIEPLLGSVMALFRAMGIVLTVKPLPQAKLPPLKIDRKSRRARQARGKQQWSRKTG
jgi:probable addiction module antidote protein